MNDSSRKAAVRQAKLGQRLGRLFAITSCVFAIIGVDAQAGLVHDPSVTPESAYLNHAQFFPSVGWLSAQNESFIEQEHSSGTLIYSGPTGSLVLTSAHSLLSDNFDPSTILAEFQFGLGANIESNLGENYYAQQAFVHPGYIGIESGPDLGILFFREQFTSASPAALYTEIAYQNKIYDVVGYGLHGTATAGILGFDGEKRAGQGTIDQLESPTAGYVTGFFRQPGHPEFLDLGMQVTNGYSGGGGFIDGKLALVTADAGSFRYGGSSTFFKIAGEVGWIEQVKSSTVLVAVPEPSSFLFLGMLVSGIGVYKGRSRLSFGRHGQINSADAPVSKSSIESVS